MCVSDGYFRERLNILLRIGIWCRYNRQEGLSLPSIEDELVGNDERLDRIPGSPSTTTRYPVPEKAHFSTLMSRSKAFLLLGGSDD